MRRSLRDFVFPIQYLEIFESLIRSAGGDLAELYRACEISAAQASNMSGTLNGEQLRAAIDVSRRHCRPARAELLQFLDHIPVTVHGPLGLLILASPTFGDAVQAAVTFTPVILPAFALRFELIGQRVHLIFERQADFGVHNELLTELVIGSFSNISPFLSLPFRQIEMHFRHADVHHLGPRLEHNGLVVPLHFGAPHNMMTFERSGLDIELLTQSRSLRAVVESALSQQAVAEHAQPISHRVKLLIRQFIDENRVYDGETIAEAMHLSARTLSRRLSDEGTTLPKLRAQVQMAYAEACLLNSHLPIAEIALRSGFTELSNFTRAFKRAFGLTPAELRDPSKRKASS